MKFAAVAGAVAALMLSAPGAWAEDPEVLGEHGDWAAFRAKTSKGTVCYIASQPKTVAPKGAKRGDIFFIITRRGTDGGSHEVMTDVGYPLKKGSDVTAEVGGDKFVMFTDGSSAWVETPADEEKIVAAMKRGSSMIVRGTSWRDTNTTDEYSLSGVTAAMDQIAEVCK